MKRTMLLLAAGAMAMAPSATLAKPGTVTTTQVSSQAGGPTSTGQPGVECGDEDAPNSPGQAATAPGSAFNGDGTAHGVYAGEQDVNTRNLATVSQYDAACQLHPPQ